MKVMILKTASDMKTAFELYGGVKGCYAMVLDLESSIVQTSWHGLEHPKAPLGSSQRKRSATQT